MPLPMQKKQNTVYPKKAFMSRAKVRTARSGLRNSLLCRLIRLRRADGEESVMKLQEELFGDEKQPEDDSGFFQQGGF